MLSRVSAVVTIEDIDRYFAGEKWRKSVKDGEIRAFSETTEIEIKGLKPRFHLRVEALDDPSDSGDFKTNEPLKELAAFLGRDIPGGEHFEKMSSGRPEVMRLLHSLANMMDTGQVEPRRLARILKVLSVHPNRAVTASAQRELEDSFVADLQKKMESKGWKVKKEYDDRDLPVLIVDISGVYEAKISVESLEYHYKFQIIGDESTKQEGKTSDPLTQYRAFYKSPEVVEAIRDLRQRAESARSFSDDVTRAPARA